MFLKVSKPREEDSNASLDFRSALSTQSETSGQKDGSKTGVKVRKSPSSILPQSLSAWRKDNAQQSAAKAADELHNLYENLPPEALELTFRDMMGRNMSPEGKSNIQAGKLFDKSPGTKPNDGSAGGDVKDVEPSNGEPSKENEKENAPKVTFLDKISLMLSRNEVHASSKRTVPTTEELNRQLERRRRKAAASDREGLYSASSTPTTSFRLHSPVTSQRLSPSHSFSDLMSQVDGHSFRKSPKISPTPSSRDLLPGDGLSNSDTYLASSQNEGRLTRVSEGSQHQRVRARSPEPQTSRATQGRDANDCSTCSASNLFFLKTSCVICGKAFCPKCRTSETIEVFGGRKCKNNCGDEQQSAESRKKMVRARRKGMGSRWKLSLGSCLPGPVMRRARGDFLSMCK